MFEKPFFYRAPFNTVKIKKLQSVESKHRTVGQCLQKLIIKLLKGGIIAEDLELYCAL